MPKRDRCTECRNGFNRRSNDWITGRVVVRRHSLGYCTDCFRKLDEDGSLTAKLEAIRELQLLVEAHDRMYALGVPSPFLDKLQLLIDGKIEAEGERILAMTQEEVFAECRARGEDPHEVAAMIRKLLLGAIGGVGPRVKQSKLYAALRRLLH